MKESYSADAMKIPQQISSLLRKCRRRCSASCTSLTSFTSFTSFTSSTSFDHRVRLDLHQHFWRNQFAYFHHARRRPDLSEEFAMRSTHLLPLRDIRHEDTRPHNVLQRRACLGERRLDVPDRLHRLCAQVA